MKPTIQHQPPIVRSLRLATVTCALGLAAASIGLAAESVATTKSPPTKVASAETLKNKFGALLNTALNRLEDDVNRKLQLVTTGGDESSAREQISHVAAAPTESSPSAAPSSSAEDSANPTADASEPEPAATPSDEATPAESDTAAQTASQESVAATNEIANASATVKRPPTEIRPLPSLGGTNRTTRDPNLRNPNATPRTEPNGSRPKLNPPPPAKSATPADRHGPQAPREAGHSAKERPPTAAAKPAPAPASADDENARVNPQKLRAMREALHKRVGQPGYFPHFDLNHDNVIDEKDMTLLTRPQSPQPNQSRTR